MPQISQIQPHRRRILVLGSALQTQSVTAYAWNDLPKFLNVADYDVVILDFTSIAGHALSGSTQDIRPERLPTWQQLARLLFSSGSEIICIGFPALSLSTPIYQAMTWWLPVTPEFVMASGEAVRDIKSEFNYYFDYVHRWFFYATPRFKAHFLGLGHYMRVIHPHINNLRVGMGAIARTRFQHPIAFKLIFQAGYAYTPRALSASKKQDQGQSISNQQSTSIEPLLQSGTVIWLPPPTEISSQTAISLILRQRYQLISSAVPPAWVESYQLPNQAAIAHQIQQQQQHIQHLSQELQLAEAQLAATSDYSLLLYESDADRLALTVCQILQTFNAQVKWLNIAHGLQLTIVDPTGREAVIAICASRNSLCLQDIRQLDRSVRDLLLQHNWRGKGILLANPVCHVPPHQRQEVVSSDCIRAARELGYCLLTTTQLFQAIANHQRHSLNLTEFWTLIFAANGVCSLPEPS